MLVYNVPKCVAFHDGVHDYEEINTYKDALTSFAIGNACKNCGEGNVTEYEPALDFLGYSAQINGDLICLGYKTNFKTLAALPELSYGVLAVAPGDADMSAFEPLKPDMSSNLEDKKVLVLPVERKYAEFHLIIKGFDKHSAYYEEPIVMCAYVTDGEKVDYLCLDELNNIAQKEYASSLTFKFIAEECFSQK